MKAKDGRAAGPLVGGARAGLREARSGSIGWRLGGGDRGRAQGSLAGEVGAGLQRARAFVAVMEAGAVFRKVREGVLAGRARGGRRVSAAGRRARTGEDAATPAPADSRAGLEPAPPVPSRVKPVSGNPAMTPIPSALRPPWSRGPVAEG